MNIWTFSSYFCGLNRTTIFPFLVFNHFPWFNLSCFLSWLSKFVKLKLLSSSTWTKQLVSLQSLLFCQIRSFINVLELSFKSFALLKISCLPLILLFLIGLSIFSQTTYPRHCFDMRGSIHIMPMQSQSHLTFYFMAMWMLPYSVTTFKDIGSRNAHFTVRIC